MDSKILTDIDAETAKCCTELEIIANTKRELTRDLDKRWEQVEKRVKELKMDREKAFLNLYPTLYVIRGQGSPRGRTGYSSFKQILACFTTREAAETTLSASNPSTYGSHHDFSYQVKVEATVNIPKSVLENLNNPPKRWLGWSP